MTVVDAGKKPTAKELFNKYFKSNSIIWVVILVIAAVYISFRRGFDLSALIDIFLLGLVYVLFFGFRDYYFYEKRIQQIILRLLNQSPIKEFVGKGFIIEEGDKLCGHINDFEITLSPYANISGEHFLTILIPLRLREGLDDYFVKFNEFFKFTLTDELLFAVAVIKDYDKEIVFDIDREYYDFEQLYKTIDDVTKLLKERDIQPLKVTDD